MQLLRFRVTNFRSVVDSGWIEADRVTAFIGINESGKTNLLLPLWKLNPARDGEIVPTSDYPKTNYAAVRENPSAFIFIRAEFHLGDIAKNIAASYWA
jgi:recombinational DNA repair ATPase RecF